MRLLAIASALSLSCVAGAASAQSGSVRIEPGYFCALNKCMRFSQDLSSVKIQSRRPVSVESYNLRSNPVVSAEVFSEIFYKALRAPNISSVDR